MGQENKALMYNALKASGVQFDKHYRNYTEADLQPAYDLLLEKQQEAQLDQTSGLGTTGPDDTPEPEQRHEPESVDDSIDPDAAKFFGYGSPEPEPAPVQGAPTASATYGEPTPLSAQEVRQAEQDAQRVAPVAERNPEEMAGERLNTNPEMEPIRTDEQGRVWFQEEVLKPAYAKPRGRRVLQYTDPGTVTKTVKAGEFIESFEVAGEQTRISEVKITLPSYQVGIYKDPRFPFKVHTYGGNNGFDLFEVQDFYGGAELVPVEVKRMYVENVLCYDIRTTVRAIETEARQLQLQGRI